MNETASWFSTQLQSTLEGLTWSIHQVPQSRWLLPPPPVLGEWSAARHLFHMWFYEATIALPSMRIWLGDPIPDVSVNEDQAWANLTNPTVEELEDRFISVRQEQRALLPIYEAADWEQILMTGWHLVSLKWVVSKTFQHTAEHTHDIMRLALFWDVADYL